MMVLQRADVHRGATKALDGVDELDNGNVEEEPAEKKAAPPMVPSISSPGGEIDSPGPQ